VPQPIAIWNRARGVWEVPQTESLICGHSERFSETWPSSGMTQGGSAYALPTLVHRTADSGCSSLLLPTPDASMGNGGRQRSQEALASGDRQANLNDLPRMLLPTPNAADGMGGPGNSGRDGGLNLRTAVTLLPTPSVADASGGHTSRSSDRSNELLLPGVAKSIGATTNPRFADGNES
jgi:hypothetical protein